MDEFLFMLRCMELEGELKTRDGRIHLAIKCLRNDPDRNNVERQFDILQELDLIPLTLREMEYIEQQVSLVL